MPAREAESKAQKLETQAATLSKILNAGTGSFWPPVTEELAVAKGYEAALGVTGRQYKRRRRLEFLDFMNRVVAQNAGREIHVILDNLNTHKPKNDRCSSVRWM